MARECTLRQLAVLAGGQIEGDPELVVRGLNSLDLAGPGELAFILDRKQLSLLAASGASACIAPPGPEPLPVPGIIVGNPGVAAARIHSFFLDEGFTALGVHPSAVIGKGCRIPEAVSIGPLVCLGEGVTLGERVRISAGAVIGAGVSIGEDSVVHAHATVARGCVIGRRVILQHGCVIGSDGFGFATDEQGCHHRRPQAGIVRIDDDVEIGANSCVDRAAFGETRIREGVKIDNLVMIGHNVDIGPHSILCGQAGIAGSSTLGRNVVLGARAGIGDHLLLGDRVMAAAMSGVHNNQPDGAVVGGYPALEARQWSRCVAAYARLPEILKELRRLKKEVEELRRHAASLPHAEQHKEDIP